jgi:cysteinyl-tRNA synthetase
MPIKIYSTLSRKKEILKPIKGKDIKLFVCGITPYDNPHIGHAKTYIQFDFIVKYLRFKKYNLFYLQNITDIDDRIIEKSQREKSDWKSISDRYEKIFLQNMDDLHVNSISKYAHATDYIKDIITQVKTLIKKGYAYKIEDGYYFDLSKFPDYGKLSGRTTTDAESAITRIDDSLSKKNKGDFCLWKFSKENEPSWQADIGTGRPGWHIEDTAITEHFFGPQYDMHGGARDLIFPHHEAEIAQMESASGKKPLVKYWLHTGFLNISGTKMSKSLGNFITISELLKKYDYRLVRFFYLTKQYRTPIDFSYDLIDQSKTALDRLNEFVNNSKKNKSKLGKKVLKQAKREFYAALDDDFDTPKAFSVLFDFVREANKQGPNEDCYKFMKEINLFLDILNFDQQEIPKEMLELAKKRLEARKNKEFKLADELRFKVIEKGYIIEDSDNGFKIKKKE